MPKFIRNFIVLMAALISSAVAQVCTAGPAADPQRPEAAESSERVGIFSETELEQAADSTEDSTEEDSGLVEVESGEVDRHRIGTIERLRVPIVADDCKGIIGSRIGVRVVVDEHGNVVSATPAHSKRHRFSQHLYDLAGALAVTQKYRPFERQGKPVSVTFVHFTEILPPEELPEVHVPFPRIRDWQSLRIKLERFAYKLEIRGDGTVLYNAPGYGYLVNGKHQDHISHEAVAAIVAAFQEADYFSLRGDYSWPEKQSPGCASGISISFGKHIKSLRDCGGAKAGMPQSVIDLEDAISRLAAIEKWLWGNSETVPSLAQEGFDFTSPAASEMLGQCSNLVLRDLLDAGVMPNLQNEAGLTQLFYMAYFATKDDDVERIRIMLSYGADPNAVGTEGETILMAAARAGQPAIIAEILKYSPDVNAQDSYGRSAIYEAVRGYRAPATHRAEAVRMLAHAGADLNLQDEDGNTLLHMASEGRANADESHVDVVRALIENGAHVNVRNHYGWTPLMLTSSPEITRLLLDAGADISLRNDCGWNALQAAQITAKSNKLDTDSAEAIADRIAILKAATKAEKEVAAADPPPCRV